MFIKISWISPRWILEKNLFSPKNYSEVCYHSNIIKLKKTNKKKEKKIPISFDNAMKFSHFYNFCLSGKITLNLSKLKQSCSDQISEQCFCTYIMHIVWACIDLL